MSSKCSCGKPAREDQPEGPWKKYGWCGEDTGCYDKIKKFVDDSDAYKASGVQMVSSQGTQAGQSGGGIVVVQVADPTPPPPTFMSVPIMMSVPTVVVAAEPKPRPIPSNTVFMPGIHPQPGIGWMPGCGPMPIGTPQPLGEITSSFDLLNFHMIPGLEVNAPGIFYPGF
jgi:hypothetical protein